METDREDEEGGTRRAKTRGASSFPQPWPVPLGFSTPSKRDSLMKARASLEAGVSFH